VKAKTSGKNRGKIFVISGPSGSGKTTLLSLLVKDKKFKDKLQKSVSLTTRKKRLAEKQGRDYFFVTKNQFERKLKAKKILEWTNYLGYYYGTPKEFVDEELAKGRNLGFCLDLRGAGALKKAYPEETIAIFVLPPSLRVLKARIEGRCRSTASSEVLRRLAMARRELKACRRFDYCVLNKNLKVALNKLKKIVLTEMAK